MSIRVYMELTKVFTKYDKRYEVINVPYFKSIHVPGFTMGLKKLCPIREEQGLEGVVFVTYGELSGME